MSAAALVAKSAATVFAIASDPTVRSIAGNFGHAVRPLVRSAVRRTRATVRRVIKKGAVRAYNKRVPRKIRRRIKRWT